MIENDRFSEIFEVLVMEHASRPRNFGELNECSTQAAGVNPLAGDQFLVQIQIEGDRIERLAFSGKGSALATASASIMTEHLRRLTIDQAKVAVADALRWINEEPSAIPDDLADDEFAVLLEIQQFPHRRNCASFAWRTVLSALEKYE